MTKIKTLKTQSGEVIYPLTSTKAVVDENGNTVEKRLLVADGEDLDADGNVLRLKDRPATDGMGYVILRKGKTFQEQVTKANTIYEIRYDFDLGRQDLPVVLDTPFVLPSTGGAYYRTGDHINVEAGMTVDLPAGGVLFDSTLSAIIPAPYTPSSKKSLYVGKLQSEAALGQSCVYSLHKDVVIPENCVLKFEGGCLKNGTIVGDETRIYGMNVLYHIFLKGTFFEKTIDLKWYNALTIDDESYNNKSVTDSFLTELVTTIINEGKSDIKFGCGIYGFQDVITVTNVKSYLKITGEGEAKTCLFFPNSKGFFFKYGGLGNATFDNFMIHSEDNCIQFYCNTSSDRFNYVHGTIFSNLRLLSNHGTYAMGADQTLLFFLYHNIFKNVQVYAKYGFVNWSGLGTYFDNVTDNRFNFLGKRIAKIDGTSLFYNCKSIVWQNSNTTYAGIDHIYYADFDEVPAYGCFFDARNCNMEGLEKEFVYTKGTDGSLGVNFENCVFISSIDTTGDYNHMVITVPTNIKGVTNQTTILHNTDNIRRPLKIKAVDFHLLRDTTYTFDKGSNIYEETEPTVSSTNDYLSHSVVLDGKKHYFTPKSYTDAKIAISEYPMRPITRIELSSQQTIASPYKMYYELIADKDNYTFTLPSFSQMQNVNNGDVFSLGNPIVFHNRSKFCIQLKNQLYQFTLLPRCYYVWFGHNAVLEGVRSIKQYNTRLFFHIKYGEIIDGLLCAEENSGFYSSATVKRNTEYSNFGYYDDFPLSYNTLVRKGEYVYMCVTSGVTASSEVEYPTEFNSIVVDGTASFVCVGKSANMVALSGELRPTVFVKGFPYFDTTLNKPIWWNGAAWVDALGMPANTEYSEVVHVINGEAEMKVISTDPESSSLSIYAPTKIENDGYVNAVQGGKAQFVDPADLGLK